MATTKTTSQGRSLPGPFYAHTEEHTLNLEYPERNTGGMLVLRANDIEVDSELIDSITIFKPLFDLRDYKKTKAILHENGGGISVFEPSVPTYLVNKVQKIHKLVHYARSSVKTKCW